MNLSKAQIILSIILIHTITNCSGQVHDFTYSQYTADLQVIMTSGVRLIPQRPQQTMSRFELPNLWEVNSFLQLSLAHEEQLPTISNIAGEIAYVKNQVSRFLKLSSMAELIVKNIRQLPPMKNDLNLEVKQEEWRVLEQQESKLALTNFHITEKSQELEQLVAQLNRQQQNPLFKQAALSFQKKALQQKVALFQSVLSQTSQTQPSTQVTQFFNDLQTTFAEEFELVDTIRLILSSHNQVTAIKSRINSLTEQLNLYAQELREKQQCHQQFLKIKHHDSQTTKLLEQLKKLKIQSPVSENEYCEGVQKKLTDRIRKLMKTYNYIFLCASQLPEIRATYEATLAELEAEKKKLSEMEGSNALENFRTRFQLHRKLISAKMDEIKDFRIQQYQNNPGQLRQIIESALIRIHEIDSNLQNLPTAATHDFSHLQKQIIEKVHEIQHLKTEYCRQHSKYQENSQIIQQRIYSLEQQQSYNRWIRTMEVQKLAELQQIQAQMKEIKEDVLTYLI